MKVSIITAVYNNKEHIEDCLKSVIDQDYKNIEYIIIDGGSTDGTLEIVNRYKDSISIVISEPDNGIYDALNKGIRLATGDIIGILHSDDLYANEYVVQKVVKAFIEHHVQGVYGDLVYIDRNNTNKVIRYWKGGEYKLDLLKRGWMSPHPTFFVKKEIYDKYGFFDTTYKIASDYDLILRFLWQHKISIHYIPEVLIKMKMGGISNKRVKHIITKSLEDYRALRSNKVGGILTLFFKNILKIPQFFRRDKVEMARIWHKRNPEGFK